MTRVRRIDDLLERNRLRNVAQARPRPELSGRDGLPLRARRNRRRREGVAVRVARLMVVLALGLFAVGLWQQRVQRIAVEGLLLGPVDQVHAACAPLLGQRWVNADTRSAGAALQEQSWFEHVSFARRLPATVLVRLVEAEPVFHVESKGASFAVDAHGCLLAASSTLDVRALPVLRGVTLEGGSLIATDRSRIERLVSALGRAPWPWEGGLAAVELHARGVVDLVTQGGVVIRLDESDPIEQLRAADAAWGRLELAAGDRLDLRYRRQVVLARAADAAPGG
jgi:cell division septal protein FtsQ